MATGLAVRAARLGSGALPRLLAFNGMCLAAWWWAPHLAAALWGAGALAVAQVFGATAAVIWAFLVFVTADEKWGLSGMLRMVPFVAWRRATDDGKTVRVWAILFWPLIAAADFVVTLCLAAVLVAVGAVRVLRMEVRHSE